MEVVIGGQVIVGDVGVMGRVEGGAVGVDVCCEVVTLAGAVSEVVPFGTAACKREE